jgi:excinuclease ABC subunit C
LINITDKLKNKIIQIPELPGIYKMLDSKGNIIYVGKSKSLKKRVKTYFSSNPKWEKVKRMVLLIDDIEYTVTDTHLEAMLLECEWIKSIKPIFNSQMKNDKKYAYLKIENYNVYNSLKVVNYREENSYGPFRRKFFLKEIIDSFKNLYPIEKVNDSYNFMYHLFPVSMDKNLFEDNKKTLLNLFNDINNMKVFIECLNNKMKEESYKCNFESASIYRDMIENINYLKNGISRYNEISTKNILLKIPVEKGYKLFFISNGYVILKEKHLDENIENIDINKFIEQGKILLSPFKSNMDEKSYVDYRDILYSEIMNLSNEMVEIL